MITYVRNAFPDAKYSRVPVARWGILQHAPGQGADGYGKKITTDYMVRIGKMAYRVYATCFSNCASHWIVVKGKTYHVGDFDIPDFVRQDKPCPHENTGVTYGKAGKSVLCNDCGETLYRGQGGPDVENDPAYGC